MQINDSQFGVLTFDSAIGWWEGRVTLPSGSSFNIYIHTPSDSDNTITEPARDAFDMMQQSEMVARQFASDQLLEIHNDEWSEGKKINSDEFMARLIPATIQVWPNGDAEIGFDDDDLFWGHEVGIRYRGGQFTEAVVQG